MKCPPTTRPLRSLRHLHLFCYDIRRPARRAAALKLARAHAMASQKSVHELYLTDTERSRLLAGMRHTLDDRSDRFVLLRPDAHTPVLTLGRAQAPELPDLIRVA